MLRAARRLARAPEMERRCPRPVRARFFEIYRAARARPASGPHRPVPSPHPCAGGGAPACSTRCSTPRSLTCCVGRNGRG
eukprot:gene20431-biopygen13098